MAPFHKRKIKLFIAASLDGYIAGSNGEIDWLFSDQDYGYNEFIAGIDTTIMGRKTYEAVQALGEWPYEELTNYVITRRAEILDDSRVIFTSGPIADLVSKIKNNPGKDIYLVGGGELARGFFDEGLVDEIILGIHPIILGDGIPLIPRGTRRTALNLVDLMHYSSGLVMAKYQI